MCVEGGGGSGCVQRILCTFKSWANFKSEDASLCVKGVRAWGICQISRELLKWIENLLVRGKIHNLDAATGTYICRVSSTFP